MRMTKKIIALLIGTTCSMMMAGICYAGEAEQTLSGPGLTSGSYIVTISADSVNVNKTEDSDEVLTQVYKDGVYQVLEDCGDGWVKIAVGDGEGYLPIDNNAVMSATSSAEEAISKTTDTAKKAAEAELYQKRLDLVDYALSFVGCRYVAGGSGPNGFDCSGFTSYVMRNGAGIIMNRSSSAQSTQGTAISASQLKPGDLIFYGSGSGINHVAMYIGDGKVVHASTERTGVKTSDMYYRTPVKMISMF